MASPLVAVLCQRFPQSRRRANFAGLVILTSALIAASFTNTAGALLATQGVLYGIGGVTLYFPAMYLIDEWFIARKGLAFAIIWTGSGLGGAVVPFVSQWLLDSYGFRTTLRVWAVIIVSRSRSQLEFIRRLTLSTGCPCVTIHHGGQKPSSSFERQHAAAFWFRLLEHGVLLDILIWKYDAVDRLFPAAVVDTIVCSRVWHATHRRSTRFVPTQPRSLRRLHLSGHDGRSLPPVRSRLRRDLWLDNCRFHLLGTHHVAGDALCLRHLVGFDWWWVCWQLGWVRKIDQDFWVSHRHGNGRFAAVREQGSRINRIGSYQ